MDLRYVVSSWPQGGFRVDSVWTRCGLLWTLFRTVIYSMGVDVLDPEWTPIGLPSGIPLDLSSNDSQWFCDMWMPVGLNVDSVWTPCGLGVDSGACCFVQ